MVRNVRAPGRRPHVCVSVRGFVWKYPPLRAPTGGGRKSSGRIGCESTPGPSSTHPRKVDASCVAPLTMRLARAASGPSVCFSARGSRSRCTGSARSCCGDPVWRASHTGWAGDRCWNAARCPYEAATPPPATCNAPPMGATHRLVRSLVDRAHAPVRGTAHGSRLRPITGGLRDPMSQCDEAVAYRVAGAIAMFEVSN